MRLTLYLIHLQIGDAKEIKRPAVVLKSWTVGLWPVFFFFFCILKTYDFRTASNKLMLSKLLQDQQAARHPQHVGVARFDPFEILEVSPGASAAEVKKVRSLNE